VLHAGLDLSRKRVDVCLLSDHGELIDHFPTPADRDGLYGLTRRVAVYDEPVRGVVESMNGARFVHDELVAHGWEVLIADAQKVKGLAPLACKTDKSAWAAAHPRAMKCSVGRAGRGRRKTDLSDAEWLSDVAAHGMVRPSFVPPRPIRELRELTRYRKTQSDARAAEIHRLEKVLQDAGIKLTSVASRVLTQSGRAMIEALIAGERDGAKLADLAMGKMRPKVPALTEALTGHFGAHHAVVCRRILDHLDFLGESISALTDQIDQRTAAFAPVYTSLLPVPGFDRISIDVIIAETGADMSRFPTPGDLASWVGVCPGSHESAGKHRRVGTTQGNPWLQRALVESARAAARTKGSYFGAQYRQIARRRGPNKAAMAVAHSLIALVWHLLSTGEIYNDLGDDYFIVRDDPERRARRLVAQLEQLGFKVTLEAPAAA
jgi:transposase